MFSWCNSYRGDQAEPSLIPVKITVDKVAVADVLPDVIDEFLSECSEEPDTTPSATPALSAVSTDIACPKKPKSPTPGLSVVSTDLTSCPKKHKTTEVSRLNWNSRGYLWEDETAMMVIVVGEYYDEGFGPYGLGDEFLYLVFGFVTDPRRFMHKPYVKDFPDAWRFWRSIPRHELYMFLKSMYAYFQAEFVRGSCMRDLIHGLWKMYLRRQKKVEWDGYLWMYDRFITALEDWLLIHHRLTTNRSWFLLDEILDFIYDNETPPILNVPAKKH